MIELLFIFQLTLFRISLATFSAAVITDATTSAYTFGAREGYEKNVLYEDVQYHPFRFGLRRAAIGVGVSIPALILKKKNHGKIANAYLISMTVVTFTVAIRNQQRLP